MTDTAFLKISASPPSLILSPPIPLSLHLIVAESLSSGKGEHSILLDEPSLS
jgi:hypothetical protein